MVEECGSCDGLGGHEVDGGEDVCDGVGVAGVYSGL